MSVQIFTYIYLCMYAYMCAYVYHTRKHGCFTQSAVVLAVRQPPRYIIHRVVGNDLPPLQSPGQLYYNVKFIVENEPHFEGERKSERIL